MPKQSRKIPGGARIGGLAVPLAAESQRKSRSLLFIIPKFWGGLLIPVLSHPLCPLSSDMLSSRCRLRHPWSSDAPCCWLRAFWPAAAITHFPGCWSLVPGFPCPYVICASSFFSHYVSLLCYLSDCLYFLTIFLYHLRIIPHILCFSIFLSTYVLNFTFWSCSLRLSVYAPAHISEFLGSCVLVCLTGSVSVAYLHPLIVGAFAFTRKHTKCSSDHLKEVVSFTEQLVWVSLCIESSSEKEMSSIRFQKVRFLLQCLPPACFVRLSKLFTFSELQVFKMYASPW